MKILDLLVRERDQKIFQVKELSHWSAIVSISDNETDMVKYFGGSSPFCWFISVKGDKYKLED